jgi:hypothetical protein
MSESEKSTKSNRAVNNQQLHLKEKMHFLSFGKITEYKN